MSDDRILEGIQRELAEDDLTGVVVGYVLVVAWVDDKDNSRVLSSIMDEQATHVTLGLLEFGSQIERDRIRRAWTVPE